MLQRVRIIHKYDEQQMQSDSFEVLQNYSCRNCRMSFRIFKLYYRMDIQYLYVFSNDVDINEGSVNFGRRKSRCKEVHCVEIVTRNKTETFSSFLRVPSSISLVIEEEGQSRLDARGVRVHLRNVITERACSPMLYVGTLLTHIRL